MSRELELCRNGIDLVDEDSSNDCGEDLVSPTQSPPHDLSPSGGNTVENML